MKAWALGALTALMVLIVGGCSSNKTQIEVTITTTTSGATTTSLTLLQSTSAQFEATVTGVSSNIVFWQICLPSTSTSTTTAPTNCTQGLGPTQCTNIPKVSRPLTGFGTITLNGLYTAPPAPPQPDSFLIVATSCIDTTKFGTFTLVIDSGVRVKISPSSATVGETETFQFNVTVTGTANLGVSWQVCQSGTSGLTNCVPSGTVGPNGEISSSGLYTAPATATSATIEVISAADQNQSATATVSVAASTPPAVTAIDPATAAQGSVQQDVYFTGSNFFSTTSVIVNGVTLPIADVNIINATLLRATIPAAQLSQAGTIQVGVQDQEGNPASLVSLDVVPVRPALVSAFPGSVPQSSASSPTVILTGGFFAPSTTTATFNGLAASATVTSSRQLSLAIPSGNLSTPGLYPIVVTNSGLTAGQPNMAAINLGVTPLASSIPGAASATTVPVGTSPSAIAIDEADGIAVVANTGSDTVSLISLAAPPTLIGSINVGSQPTGVAVDDLLPHPTALVVNSGDFTLSAIDLTTKAVVGTALAVNIGPLSTSPIPFSVGINPLTHRALVAYQSTNQATVLDLSTGTPANPVQIGGGSGTVSFGTGTNPAVAIDPRLNWAVVTPGGSGAASMVDLGMDPGAGQPSGRAPQVIASIAISSSSQGIGIDPEAHEALVSDPQAGTLTVFSLLNFAVNSVTEGSSQFSQKGFGAAAASSLENVGIAVSGSTPGASAVIVNLQNGAVLQTVGGFDAANLQAVAVDPVTNQAIAVDQKNNQVYFVSLGPALNPVQIVEASPAVIFGGASATANVTLTINGSGFSASSVVTLDGTPLTTAFVSARQITATVPGGVGGLLSAPRNFAVQVVNPGNMVSNVTDLTVIVPVPVGNAPVGVAVDTDRNLAIVTNLTDGTASLVTLTPETPIGPTQSQAGSIEAIGPITVGTTPEGVTEIPRMGLALVANNGSNDLTLIDVTQASPPVALCPAGCGIGPTGVAVDQDSASALVTDADLTSPTSTGGATLVTGIAPATSTALPTATATVGPAIDHNPVAVAIDSNPLFPYAAVATDSSTSSIDFLDLSTSGTLVGRTSGLSNPTGVVFDPVNQVFLAANSLENEIVIDDPTTFLPTPVSVGIGPTSLDYNFQTSTLVTVNSISNTMSVLSYVCPPTAAAPACLGPQVSTILGLGGTQVTTPVFGPNAIAVDPILNLAVLVDEDNNQVLLVPLPH
jgi:DNA-binding beta-propeller fold protein YncE